VSIGGAILAVCCLVAATLTPSSDPARVTTLPDAPPATAASPTRFQTVDVYIDTANKPLAAYQFTLRAAAGNALLSGITGGDHSAFARPPYYDKQALIDERIVIAALSTDETLPHGRTRVVRLNVQVSGGDDPRYEVTLQAAAEPDGTAVPAKVTLVVTER
jgi:hypothetical protein